MMFNLSHELKDDSCEVCVIRGCFQIQIYGLYGKTLILISFHSCLGLNFNMVEKQREQTTDAEISNTKICI